MSEELIRQLRFEADANAAEVRRLTRELAEARAERDKWHGEWALSRQRECDIGEIERERDTARQALAAARPLSSPTEEQVERALGAFDEAAIRLTNQEVFRAARREGMRAAIAAVLPDAEGWREVQSVPSDATEYQLRMTYRHDKFNGLWDCIARKLFMLPAPPKEKADE